MFYIYIKIMYWERKRERETATDAIHKHEVFVSI